MVCICDTNITIRNCPPFANADDIVDLIAAICPDCVGTVPALTDSSNFCSLAFGGAMDECCDLLIVFEGTRIWFSTDCSTWYQAGCDVCWYEVPPATPESSFCTLAQGAGVDTDCCVPMFIYDGTNVYMSEDCVTWFIIASASKEVEQAASENWTGSSVLAGTGVPLDLPQLADMVITTEQDGLVIAQTWAYLNNHIGSCGTALSVYNVTLGTWFTTVGYGDPSLGLDGPLIEQHYQRLVAGTYTFRVYYQNGGGCTSNTIVRASQFFHTVYDNT
jgi:hypothetical protein